MPKSCLSRLAFALVVLVSLFIIGRNLYRHSQENALVAAVNNGAEATALALLAQGAYANQPQELEHLMPQALMDNAPGLVCALLNKGADPNGVYAGSPLLFKAINDCPAAVKCLLDKGANLNVASGSSKNGSGETALNLAAARGNLALIRLLLARGARPDASKPDKSALRAAVANPSLNNTGNSLEITRALLDAGPSQATKDAALPAAIGAGRVEFVKLLLERGARPNVASLEWQTALAQAKQRRNAAVLKLLQADKVRLEPTHALVDARNSQQQTALLVALAKGEAENAHILVARGADVNAADKYGRTPLVEAVNHCPALIPDLLAKGANPNVVTLRADTPLNLAILAGNELVVRQLLAGGANANLHPPQGHTPLYWARKHSAAKILLTRQLTPQGGFGNLIPVERKANTGGILQDLQKAGATEEF